MTVQTLLELVEKLVKINPDHPVYLAVLISEPSDELLKIVRDMGYAAMFRTTAFGHELVITDKIAK